MEVDASDGRIYLSSELREKYGEKFRIVERQDGIVLLPVPDDPLAALRAEFDDVDKSARELRDETRQAAREDAGQ